MSTENYEKQLLMDVEACSKTLRDLPLFGVNSKPEDFRWPTAKDLLAMPADKRIHAIILRWKARGSYIAGIQVVLSNGVQSPPLLGQKQTADNMQEVALNPNIRKIKGNKQEKDGWATHIVFTDNAGAEISKIVAFANELVPEHVLAEGEEVIGVYGHKNSNSSGDFHSIGIIVWKPPQW